MAEHPTTSQYQMIQITDYGYMVMGEGQDTLPNFHLPMYLIGYNHFGEILFQKEYYSDSDYINPWKDTDLQLNDTTYLFTTLYLKTDNDTLFANLIWVDELGDTLQMKQYSSPYYYFSNDPSNSSWWMMPTSITKSDDGQFLYLVCRVVDYPPIQNSFIVMKLTHTGELVWTYHQPFDDNYYACDAVVFHQGNPWLGVAGWGGGPNYNKLLEIDNSSGEVLQSIELIPVDNLLNDVSDMLMQQDGVIISCIRMFDGAMSNPAIYKMDYNGNYIWTSEIPNGENIEQSNNHLVQAQDGGFVCAAVNFEGGPTQGVPDDYNYVYRTWLWKVDANGNFLWDRKFEYLSLDSAYFNVYTFPHDLKATPDGGFIVAGEATTTCSNYPTCDQFIQQGWLLKVDACGCLVPGCDPNCIVSVEETQVDNEKKYFRFGPNPVGETLNIFLASDEHINLDHATLELRDLMGRLIRSLPLPHNNTTYIIDAQSLTAGNYFLTLTKDGQVLQSEKMVKR